ncbi:hypothetical protein HU200_045543 [Digitaria exilis]|uniref:HMA domain-containing protein n=1 Tax=Digitaria exilis TaxID=1010633 RepID=A0A835AZR6_9POAL|nr:hypothetical protein HU200_045543 [Digitaria exilis]
MNGDADALQERLLPAAPPPETSGDADTGGADEKKGKKWEKTYLDVLGVCCSAEVALVDRLLSPIAGVRAVTVVVPSRTVVVEHDPSIASQSIIEFTHLCLISSFSQPISEDSEQAGLEASLREYGSRSRGIVGRWPSPYILTSGRPPPRLLPLAAPPSSPLARANGGLRRLAAGDAPGVRIGDDQLHPGHQRPHARRGRRRRRAGGVDGGRRDGVLFTVAEWLETVACAKATAGMTSLMGMVPAMVVLAETGEVVGVRDVRVGDVVAVRAGEVVPVDGVVVHGMSEVDESSLTGESFPVAKRPMSEVWAGTMNLDAVVASGSKRGTCAPDAGGTRHEEMVSAGLGPAGERVPVRAGVVDAGRHVLRAVEGGEDGGPRQGRASTVRSMDDMYTLETEGSWQDPHIKQQVISHARTGAARRRHGGAPLRAPPADKVDLVGDLKARDGPTMMVGDGMNDAPALAAADVGVAMGLSGSAAAMETSHATLMSGDVLRVPAAVSLGRRARRTIAVNVVFSVGTKAVVLALAMAWRPVLWAAVLADVGTCLLVVLHSMTLLRDPTGRKEEEVCRATAKSLAMRSELAGASNGGEDDGANGCHCCQKPSRSLKQEHEVVIDVPASCADHQEIQVPSVMAEGNAGGCCGAGKACGASMATSVASVPQQCCGREEEEEGSRVSVKTGCCSNGGGECDSPKKAGEGCRDARCCSGGR